MFKKYFLQICLILKVNYLYPQKKKKWNSKTYFSTLTGNRYGKFRKDCKSLIVLWEPIMIPVCINKVVTLKTLHDRTTHISFPVKPALRYDTFKMQQAKRMVKVVHRNMFSWVMPVKVQKQYSARQSNWKERVRQKTSIKYAVFLS